MSFSDPYGYIGNSPTLIGILEVWENYPAFTATALRECAKNIAKELDFDSVAPAQLLDLASGLRVTAKLQQTDAAYYKDRADAEEAAACEQYADRVLVMAKCLESEAGYISGDDKAYTDSVETATKLIALQAGLLTYSVAQWLREAADNNRFSETFTHLVRLGYIKREYPYPPAPCAPSAPSAPSDTSDPSDRVDALHLAIRKRGDLYTSPSVPNNKAYDLLTSNLGAAQMPGTLVLGSMSHVLGVGHVRKVRNQAAHKVLFRTFLDIAIREFKRMEEPGSSPLPGWQDLFALFQAIHGFPFGVDALNRLSTKALTGADVFLYG